MRTNLDTDNDQMPDDWELKYFGNLQKDGSEWVEGIEGMTVLEAFTQGLNPKNFYDGISAKVTLFSGDSQRVAPSIELNNPLEVVVLNAVTEAPLVNAPVAFQIIAGGGTFSGPSVLRTDSQGRAKVHLIAPAAISTNVVRATINSNGPSNHTDFKAVSAAPEAASNLRGTLLPGGKGISLTWQDNSEIETGYIIEMKSADGTWRQIGEVPANTTQFDYEFPTALGGS